MKKVLIPILLLVLIGVTYYVGVSCNRMESPTTDVPVIVETPSNQPPEEPSVVEEPAEDPSEDPAIEPTVPEETPTQPGTVTEAPIEVPDEPGVNLTQSGFMANLPLDDPSIRVYNGVVDPRTVTPYVLPSVTTKSVVNKFNALADDYAPDDLVLINANGVADMYVRQVAADAWEMWREDAIRDGYTVLAVSAYRTKDYQDNLFHNYLARSGEEALLFSAYPRRSEHEMGLALDLSNGWGIPGEQFIETDMGKYLADTAYKYGFILRYPKGYEGVTGYSFEPWHYRYVGVEIAAEMRHKKIPTLEHYYKLTAPN